MPQRLTDLLGAIRQEQDPAVRGRAAALLLADLAVPGSVPPLALLGMGGVRGVGSVPGRPGPRVVAGGARRRRPLGLADGAVGPVADV